MSREFDPPGMNYFVDGLASEYVGRDVHIVTGGVDGEVQVVVGWSGDEDPEPYRKTARVWYDGFMSGVEASLEREAERNQKEFEFRDGGSTSQGVWITPVR